MSRRKNIKLQDKIEAFIGDDGGAGSESDSSAGGGDNIESGSPTDSGNEEQLTVDSTDSTLTAKILFGVLISVLLGACVLVACPLIEGMNQEPYRGD